MARGPVPKRSTQRRRKNEPEIELLKAPGATEVKRPKVNSKWHPVARRWFLSLSESGQSVFYEPSDWATAVVVAESMSRELRPQPHVNSEGEVFYVERPPRASAMQSWLAASAVLMATEGDRRRLRLELQRVEPDLDQEDEGDVSWFEDARRRLREPG